MQRRRNDRQDDLRDFARELHRARPQPRDQFLQSLVSTVTAGRRPLPARAGWRRAGVAVAFSGLIVVTVASFGGIGYASSAASEAVKKVQRSDARSVHASPAAALAPSSAQAEYGAFTPPATATPAAGGTSPKQGAKPSKTSGKPTTSAGGRAGVTAVQNKAGSQAAAGQPSGASLPFTGLALWIPMAGGLLLLGLGLILRTRARKPRATA